MKQQFIEDQAYWRDWWGKAFRKIAPDLKNLENRSPTPDIDFSAVQEFCWGWWSLRLKGPKTHLNRFRFPYSVIMLYLLIIGISQLFTATRYSYLSYWDTLLTPMELRWLIPITFGFPLGFFGLWFAHHRSEQTREQISLQIKSKEQQRFVDAVEMLGSDNRFIQLGALAIVREIISSNSFEFKNEALVVIEEYFLEIQKPITWLSKERAIAYGSIHRSKLFDAVFSTYLTALTAAMTTEEHKPPIQRLPTNYLPKLNLSGFVAEHKILRRYQRNHTSFRQITITEGDLRRCALQYCEFSQCQFGAGTYADEIQPLDLTGTCFGGSVFEATYFGPVNISGVDFWNTSGLNSNSLANCVFDFDYPPQNLPPGFLLRHPFFRREDPTVHYRKTPLIDLDASCIPEFCDTHEGFEPHGDDQIITVASEDPEDPHTLNLP